MRGLGLHPRHLPRCGFLNSSTDPRHQWSKVIDVVTACGHHDQREVDARQAVLVFNALVHGDEDVELFSSAAQTLRAMLAATQWVAADLRRLGLAD
jgi:hypothetical protein